VESTLEDNFIGVYLVGSLATGDFDIDSDIDFLVIINQDLSHTQILNLQSLHEKIYALGFYPAQHLEGSYIPIDFLQRPNVVGIEPIWYVDNGSTKLERSIHDNKWHVFWILREASIILKGPNPKELMPPVPKESLQAEMISGINTLEHHFADEINKPLCYFNSRFGQSFTVLTCCRLLHTLECGRIESKRAGILWAKKRLDASWHFLIEQSWQEREGVRFGLKIRERAEIGILQDTLYFYIIAKGLRCKQRVVHGHRFRRRTKGS
jgi:hypothetical protein